MTMFEAAMPVVDTAVEAGPSVLLGAFLVWLAKGLPKLTAAATGALDGVSVFLTRGARVLLLAERWLEDQLGERARESDENLVIREVMDGASDDQVIAMLEALDPSDSVPIHLGRHGDRLRHLAKLLARRREKSGPRRSA